MVNIDKLKDKKFRRGSIISDIFYITSMLVLVLAFLTVFVYFYWLLESKEVLVIKKVPIPVETKEIRPNRPLIMIFDYCKVKDAHGIVKTSLISSRIVIDLPTYEDNQKKNCRSNLRVPILLPTTPETDTYRLRYEITYHINPIKSTTVIFESQPFKIINESLAK